MTSRERVMMSVNHKQPDKVPVDLGATPSSGISAIAYNNLKKHLGMEGGQTRIYDVVQQVVIPEQPVLDLFQVDVLDVGREYNKADSDWHETVLADGSTGHYPNWFHPVKQENGEYLAYKNNKCLARMPKGATFFDQTVFPYIDDYPDNYDRLDEAMDQVLWSAFVHSPWDHAGDENFWQDLREKCIHLKQTTDKALMIVCGCNLFEWGTFLRRIDNFLMDIYSEPEEVEKLLDALMERHMATLENVCRYVGDVVDILRFGDDLGLDSNPFMSREKYQTLFKPRHTKLCEYVHTHSKMKTFLHSCGSVSPLIPDLIDAGYDILNPIQTTARNMEPEYLKKEFGKDITFWGGGCNTRWVLNRGTPEEVYDYTKRMMDIFMAGGGYVFNQEHNILPDVPPENLIAMYKAVNEIRF